MPFPHSNNAPEQIPLAALVLVIAFATAAVLLSVVSVGAAVADWWMS